MTDTAGVSDLVFGLFWLLGYQFSPRLADIGEARFWRLDATADYGVLNGIARASDQHRADRAALGRFAAGGWLPAAGHGECVGTHALPPAE